MKTNSTQVSKTWEAYGNKEAIIYQHLEPFDKAQEALSKLIAQTVNQRPMFEQIETSTEFLTWFLKSVIKARIKMEKFSNKDDLEFRVQLDDVVSKITTKEFHPVDIDLKEYANILFKIGMLYEKLQYSLAERLRVRTKMQSDLQVAEAQTQEEMEYAPDETEDTEDE